MANKRSRKEREALHQRLYAVANVWPTSVCCLLSFRGRLRFFFQSSELPPSCNVDAFNLSTNESVMMPGP